MASLAELNAITRVFYLNLEVITGVHDQRLGGTEEHRCSYCGTLYTLKQSCGCGANK